LKIFITKIKYIIQANDSTETTIRTTGDFKMGKVYLSTYFSLLSAILRLM